MTALLEVRDLRTVFQTRAGEVHAVSGISYTLDRGRSLAIVGESGSGKSVGALSLLGLVPPPGEVTGGSIRFDGDNVLDNTAEQWQRLRGQRIAMVFQDPMTSLNPVLSIGYQLVESLRWHERLDEAAATKRVIDALGLVGIANAAERMSDYPHQFSGGQRQRIMIAMAIICHPDLLIADEPTTALDVTIQAQIVELIRDLQKKLGMAVIWITHDLALVANIVDDIAVMYAGTIVEYGPVGALFERPLHPYTQGLLKCMPRIDADRNEMLASIDGMPPSLVGAQHKCPFAPRCPIAVEQCERERPRLENTGSEHRVACWRAAST